MKNRKAISPIFATLILIAIAVIAGVVVYMFTSGTLATMTGGGTAGQEKVSIQAASATSTTAIKVYAQSTGGPLPPTTGINIIIKDGSGNTITTAGATVTGTWGSGALVTIANTAVLSPALTSGSSYTATLVTPAGGSFVSPSFKVP